MGILVKQNLVKFKLVAPRCTDKKHASGMVSKRKSRSKGKPKAETGKKERDQDTIRQINAALDADPVRMYWNVTLLVLDLYPKLSDMLRTPSLNM